MARVPQVVNRGVSDAPLPQARQSIDGVTDASFGGIAAQQTGAVADALQGATNLAGEYAIKQQAIADRSRVDDAINALSEQENKLTFDQTDGYTVRKGQAAFGGDKPLSDDYTERYQSHIKTIADGLGNDRQRVAFNREAGTRAARFRSSTMQYETEQFTDYQKSVKSGTIARATNDIGLYYNDPERVDESVLSIRAAMNDQAALNGWSAVEANTKATALISSSHKVAIERAIEQEQVEYAKKYLEKYSTDQMTADDILAVNGKLSSKVDRGLGFTVATDIVQGDIAPVALRPAGAGVTSDDVFEAMLGTESNNRQFGDNGRVLTSPKGAKGIAQVMPATGPEAAKLAGLQWDPIRFEQDADYNKRLGKAYFDAKLKEFSGDVPKAMAAYNAGAGATRSAIKKATKAGSPDSWLSYLPAETRDYVAKNTAKLTDQAPRARSLPSLSAVEAKVLADPRLVGNATAQEHALTEARQQYATAKKAMDEKQAQAFDQAIKAIDGGATFDSLPDAVREQVDPSKLPTLRAYERTLATGEKVKTDMVEYTNLMTNPEKLQAMTPTELYALKPYLSDADYKTVLTAAKPRKATKADDPEALNSTLMSQLLKPRLASLGLEANAKPTGKNKDHVPRVYAIQRSVVDAILYEQGDKGRQLTQAEMSKVIDRKFVETRANFNTPFFGSRSENRMRLFDMNVDDIKGGDLDVVKKALAKIGNISPTDSEILEMFYLIDTRQRRRN